MSEGKSLNFIQEIIKLDVKNGKNNGRVLTRFPPEPNGYLHIGHAKSICLNFGVAAEYGGHTNLRFDDTNPAKEEVEYVESIKEDVKWLGFNWSNEYFASDYFDKLYAYALELISKGLAYVDASSSEQMAAQKGTHTQPGTNSPYRDRSIDENLMLFKEMKAGQHPEGSMVLRAKIDMQHINMLMRDPIIYRIKFAHHHRTGDAWCIYPMYDFAHGQSDATEQITHSICTLEFAPHRELYNWFIAQLGLFPSEQYEFARLNLSYTLMSKRKLLALVTDGHVNGWDDPRMPTISGLRRRGYTAAAIRDFCDRIGIAKRDNTIDVSLLEFCAREDLNKVAMRVMAVLKPLKVVISNYPAGQTEHVSIKNNPEDKTSTESRLVPFSAEVWIDAEDFMENPPKDYFRLSPGSMVRLKGAYIIQCQEVIKNADGAITELRCTYVPESKSGQDTSGLKVKTALNWAPVKEGVNVTIRNYDRLFSVENPALHDGPIEEILNPLSLIEVQAIAEPALKEVSTDTKLQFIRMGYYCLDKDATADHLIFNRTVTLKDSFGK